MNNFLQNFLPVLEREIPRLTSGLQTIIMLWNTSRQKAYVIALW